MSKEWRKNYGRTNFHSVHGIPFNVERMFIMSIFAQRKIKKKREKERGKRQRKAKKTDAKKKENKYLFTIYNKL